MHTVLSQRLLKYSMRLLNAAVGRYVEKNIYYFAYGANMDRSILAANKIFPGDGIPASLDGFAIGITLPCEYVGKGFASVEPDQHSVVHGVLWQVSQLELATIDVCEWLPFHFYSRRNVKVTTRDGQGVEAFCYFATTPRPELKTSEGYRNLLVQNGTSLGFPVEYIEVLKALPVAETFKLDHSFNLANPKQKRFLDSELHRFYKLHDRAREKLCDILP